MQVFLMHIGHPGNIDVAYTVARRRAVSELVAKLPAGSAESAYFHSDPIFRAAFPDGQFNCWGIPRRAEPSFLETQVGDLVLLVPSIGVHGGVQEIGVVKAKCPLECYEASRILWPDTPNERLFPYLFFFDTEIGSYEWFEFLDDLGIRETWNPRGWYRKIASSRFAKWGGAKGFLGALRTHHGFRLLPRP